MPSPRKNSRAHAARILAASGFHGVSRRARVNVATLRRTIADLRLQLAEKEGEIHLLRDAAWRSRHA